MSLFHVEVRRGHSSKIIIEDAVSSCIFFHYSREVMLIPRIIDECF